MRPNCPHRFHQNRLNRFYYRWAQDSVCALGPTLGSLRLRIVVRLTQGWLRARFSARDTGTRLDFARLLVSVCSRPDSARVSAYHSSEIGSMRLGSIPYLGLGSSRLVAQARLGTRLGTRESAQYSARLKSELSLGSDRGPAHRSAGDWLGHRDLTWLDLGLSPAHLARFGAWDRTGARFGLEARPGSQLRARPGSGLGARLGSEPGSAHLGSENIRSLTKHERRKCETKTVRRESAKVRVDEKDERKCHTKKKMEQPEVTHFPVFKTNSARRWHP